MFFSEHRDLLLRYFNSGIKGILNKGREHLKNASRDISKDQDATIVIKEGWGLWTKTLVKPSTVKGNPPTETLLSRVQRRQYDQFGSRLR